MYEIKKQLENLKLPDTCVSDGKEYVGFDHECILFQTFSKTSKAVCGNTVIIV